MLKTRFALRAAAFAAMFALCAGSALQAQEEGGRGRGQRGGGQRGGGQRGGGQRGGGFNFGGQRGGGFNFGGQRRGGGGRTMSKAALLGMEEVRKDIGIDGDQLETLNGTLEDYRSKQRKIREENSTRPDPDAMARMRDASQEERSKMMSDFMAKREKAQKAQETLTAKLDKETDELLGALMEEAQWKRLGEIQLQSKLRGGMMAALADKDFAKKLKLTKEQMAKVDGIRKEGEKIREEMTKMFSGGRGGGFDRDAFADMREKGDEIRKKSEDLEKTLLTADQKKALETMKGKEFKFPERRGFGRGGDRGGRGGDRGGRQSGGGGDRPSRPGRPGGGDGGAV